MIPMKDDYQCISSTEYWKWTVLFLLSNKISELKNWGSTFIFAESKCQKILHWVHNCILRCLGHYWLTHSLTRRRMNVSDRWNKVTYFIAQFWVGVVLNGLLYGASMNAFRHCKDCCIQAVHTQLHMHSHTA